MIQFLSEKEPELKVYDAEVLGQEPPLPPWWRRVLSRVVLSGLLALLGLACGFVGAVLTITVVGAAIGLPLLIIGFLLLGVAVFVFLGAGSMKTITWKSG